MSIPVQAPASVLILLVAPDKFALAKAIRGTETPASTHVISRVIRSETDLHSLRGLHFDAVFGLETVDAEYHAEIRTRVYSR